MQNLPLTPLLILRSHTARLPHYVSHHRQLPSHHSRAARLLRVLLPARGGGGRVVEEIPPCVVEENLPKWRIFFRFMLVCGGAVVGADRRRAGVAAVRVRRLRLGCAERLERWRTKAMCKTGVPVEEVECRRAATSSVVRGVTR